MTGIAYQDCTTGRFPCRGKMYSTMCTSTYSHIQGSLADTNQNDKIRSRMVSYIVLSTTMGKSTLFVLFLVTTRVIGWGVQERRLFLQTLPLSGLAILSPQCADAILPSEYDNNGPGDGCDKDSDDDDDSERDEDSDDESNAESEDSDSDSSDNSTE